MDYVENSNIEDKFDYIDNGLKKIVSYIDKLENENKQLKARNDELEKENEKLHETILQIS